MNLINQVNEGIKEAMKLRQTDRLRALRGIKSAFLLLQTGEGVSEVTDEMCIKALQKMSKQRKDSIEIFEKQQREDLALIEKSELEVIDSFLPAQLSEDELNQLIIHLLTENGLTEKASMGKAMALAIQNFGDKADGKLISKIIKDFLV
jgi:uncharacterized protein YqeY